MALRLSNLRHGLATDLMPLGHTFALRGSAGRAKGRAEGEIQPPGSVDEMV